VQDSSTLYSLAHGAGRKWGRSTCRGKLGNVTNHEQMTRTSLGSRVICENKDLMFEEAPQAYKPIRQVIQDLVDFGLIEIIARTKPVLTYKTRGAIR
jgi:release factor H-coupled RctB family protein